VQPRVTAILVARNGAGTLERTLASLGAQTRKPDATIAVDLSSTDESEAMLSASGPVHVLSLRDGTAFGSAIAQAMQLSGPAESDGEWLWLLGHDNAPNPDALSHLLGAVEIAPSVAVAGPKLMRLGEPSVISGFGETVSRFGASIALVDGELDQAQHDTRDDVLGVAAAGMLVRRSVWTKLGGFDPGLPSVDAALDFSIRARLAGHRVVLVPGARVASAGGPERFARASISPSRRFRLTRTAQLHRRLVYSPAWALPLHWLSLVPLAVARAIGDLIGKRPGVIGGEFRAAFRAAFSGRVGAARRNLRRSRALGWSAIAPLRMPQGEVRELRAQAREAELAELDRQTAGGTAAGGAGRGVERAGFIANGGLWMVLLAGVVGLLAFGALLGANAVSGGGLRPLSGTVADLWANIGYGWREVGTGLLGAADPFAAVLAVLGSITFWAPSWSIVLLYLVALPVAALGAWFSARGFSRSPWPPALAAVLWAFSPPFLASLADGRIGAVVAHLLLPWLFLAALGAARSWAAGAAAALLFAGVAAGAPSIVPALLVLFVALLAARPASIHRTIGIPVPALVLFAPLLVHQIAVGNPLGLLADPGVPVAGGTASGWQLALGDATGSLHGWPAVLDGLAAPGLAAPVIVAVLLAPLGALARAALFLPGSRRAVPALLVALLGYGTAVLASTVRVGAVGADPVTVFAGPGLSLFWLGLVAAALCALEAIGRMAAPVSVLAALTTAALAIPLLGAMFIGTALVHPATGRILPALVTAEAQTSPGVGTLVLASEGAAGISVSLERGVGASLDDQSTLVSTKARPDAIDERLAVLAGNLSARSGFGFPDEFVSLGISFVLVPPSGDEDETYRAMVDALDGNEALAPVGTTANGLLWHYEGAVDPPAAHPGNTDTTFGAWYLVALGVVFGVTVLLAIPTGRPRRRVRSNGPGGPADTFEEDDNG
jgi:GT2 family glycosyltransferase